MGWLGVVQVESARMIRAGRKITTTCTLSGVRCPIETSDASTYRNSLLANIQQPQLNRTSHP